MQNLFTRSSSLYLHRTLYKMVHQHDPLCYDVRLISFLTEDFLLSKDLFELKTKY